MCSYGWWKGKYTTERMAFLARTYNGINKWTTTNGANE